MAVNCPDLPEPITKRDGEAGNPMERMDGQYARNSSNGTHQESLPFEPFLRVMLTMRTSQVITETYGIGARTYQTTNGMP